MKTFFEVLNKVVRFLVHVFSKAPKPHSYNASFAKETTLLSRYNKGFSLSGKRNLSVKDSYQNALIIGGTGTGKSSNILLPSIYTIKGSLVVHDPSGELYQKSAGYLSLKGYTILRLDFTNPEISLGFNPLKRVTDSSDAGKLATQIIQTTLGRDTDQFWSLQAISLLTILIQLLLTQHLQFRTLKSLHSLCQSILADQEKLDSFVNRYGDQKLKKSYQAFSSFEEKLRTNIVATALAALSLMNDDSIAKVTSVDTWSPESLRSEKIALFVQNPLTEQVYLSALTSIFFEQIWKLLMSRLPSKQDNDVFFLIDETSSLYLPSLPVTIANVRKFKAGIMLVLQNYNQIIHQYGKPQADTIASNCFSKLYLTGQPIETAAMLERALGKYQYPDKEGKEYVRPLMTASEIRMMSTKNAILLAGSYPPIKVKLQPYYKHWKWRKRSKLTPPLATPKIPQSLIYLNL